METFSAETFALWLATLGVVIVVAALLSGFIDRTGAPQVAVFLGIGAMVGAHGLGLLDVTLESPVLRVVATLSLALVLFTDALSLNISEVRKNVGLAIRLLGPGTLVSAGILTLAAWSLLGLSWPLALILGAALASTDPVLLRGLLRRKNIPQQARLGLRLESGINDVVVLPIIMVAMTLVTPAPGSEAAGWASVLVRVVAIGPAVGLAIGLVCVGALHLLRGRFGVRRDYESLYSLGVAFAAFAAAESVHGDGFLAAFAAGLIIAALDVELCDCFLEYGEVTAEMLLLLTFVLFGTSLIWQGLGTLSLGTVVFALLAIVVRLPVYALSLIGSGVDRRSAWFISWYGGRGLNSLLLVLLAVFAGVPGSVDIFRICCFVVLLSIVVHGGSPMVLVWLERRAAKRSEETSGDGASDPGSPVTTDREVASPQVVTIDELQALRDAGSRVVIADVRTERTYELSDDKAAGAVRLDPEHAVQDAKALDLPRDAWILPYCT